MRYDIFSVLSREQEDTDVASDQEVDDASMTEMKDMGTKSADARIAPLVRRMREMPCYEPCIYTLCGYYIRRHYVAHYIYNRKYHTIIDTADPLGPGVSLKRGIQIMLNNPLKSKIGKFYITMWLIVMFGSISTLLLETLPRFDPMVLPEYKKVWLFTEVAITVLYVIDLLMRAYAANFSWKFFLVVSNCADVVSVVPIFVEVFAYHSGVRVLRLARLIRFVNFARRCPEIDTFFVSLVHLRYSLVPPLIFFCLVTLLLSAALYSAEHGTWDPEKTMFMREDCNCQSRFPAQADSCPKIPAEFTSIPDTMWFIVQTVSSLGYGDSVPECDLGLFIGCITIISGVVFISMAVAVFNQSIENTVRVLRSTSSKKRDILHSIYVADTTTGVDTSEYNDHPLLVELRETHSELVLKKPVPSRQIQMLDWLLKRYLRTTCTNCGNMLTPIYFNESFYLRRSAKQKECIILLPRRKTMNVGSSAETSDIVINAPGILYRHAELSLEGLSKKIVVRGRAQVNGVVISGDQSSLVASVGDEISFLGTQGTVITYKVSMRNV